MQTQFTPFESIGLCFSGGGYRATFFSLGVISYLNRINYKGEPLLKHVEALSSVSGGSLLAVAYAKAVQEDDFVFEDFYRAFYESFAPGNDHLLEKAVDKLEDASVWASHPHKKRSLINAFALAYADMPVFQGQFEMFKKSSSPSLKHVCFNATEFSFGQAFRFQNIGRFGNGNLYCAEMGKLTDRIELSDIVASSSCFPIGFEPLVFPDDYIRDRKDTDYKALKRLADFNHGVGVMDGGIVDNQGIGSMVNISKSQERDKPLDLIIVNDVGSYRMDPWLADNSKGTTKVSIRQKALDLMKYFGIHWVYWLILVVGLAMMVVNSLELIEGQAWPSLYVLGGILTGIGLCLSLMGAVAGHFKNDGLKKLRSIFEENVPTALLDEVMSFQKLDMDLVKRMLGERATSGAKMLNDVFLKQIRRLNYNLLYSKEDLKNRRITSTVYQLSGEVSLPKSDITIPKKQLKRVALIASEAPTSLWWDGDDMKVDRMNSLIACGQFTTCYNLMKYILELRKNEIQVEGMDEMFKALKKDWTAFNKDPLFAVNQEEK